MKLLADMSGLIVPVQRAWLAAVLLEVMGDSAHASLACIGTDFPQNSCETDAIVKVLRTDCVSRSSTWRAH